MSRSLILPLQNTRWIHLALMAALAIAIFFAIDPALALAAASKFSATPLATLPKPTATPAPLLETSVTILDEAGQIGSMLIFGLSAGILFAATLYLFFIWIVIRDKGQFFLMLLLLCLAVNMASKNPEILTIIGLQMPAIHELLQNYSLILATIFSIFFTYYFLEIDAFLQGMQIPLFTLAGLLTLLLLATAFAQRTVGIALPIMQIMAIGAILMAGLGALRYAVPGSLSHIAAFTFLFVGALGNPLYDLGYLTTREEAFRFSYLFFSLTALFFAIVIAGQFAVRQEEKEKALAVSNERFALAARGSNEGLFDWNIATKEVYFSSQFDRILGLSLQRSQDGLKFWMKMILPSDRKKIFATLKKFKETLNATTLSFEYRITEQDDSWRWLHTKVVATRSSANGKIVRFVGSTGDITSRKRGESALKASEARFRSITEAHPVPVLIARLIDNHILYASPGAEALLGLPNGTLISHQLDRFITHSTERQKVLAAVRENADVNMMEVVLTRGDGNSFPAAISARRIAYQNEAAIVVGIYDLTEQKEAESKIAKQQEALQQSEKMAALGGLLAGVAHELNNPLSVVMGQSTLLMEGNQEPKTKSRAEKICKAADRCSRIVKSFLSLARRKPAERRPMDANAVINASLELLTYQFKTENIVLQLNLDPEIPQVVGDPDQLTQVFTNLALNATQAMHDWQGQRSLTIKSETQNKDYVLISVVDTGPGVPDEIKTRVFEPFFSTKGNGGTGVGLALCLNIIETHGGKLELKTTSGGGATFLITLPIATEGEKAQEVQPSATTQTLDGTKLRILLVDDEVELAQTLADLLEPEGHEIDLAANGAIALEKLNKKPFDLIISDLRMPVMDGPTMYAELGKSMPSFQKRIIYVTGDTLSPHVNAFLSQNPVPVIEKPYRLIDVNMAIAALLKDQAAQGSIGGADSLPPQKNI